jgi:phosphohistidine phosphatase SixA
MPHKTRVPTRREVLAWVAVGFTYLAVGCDCEAPLTVYLVRHAEKVDDGGKDPDLSEVGKRRALSLVQTLANQPVVAIFATQFKRTQQTVEPVAAAHSLPVEVVDAADTATLIRNIKSHGGGAVLVAGHSNTVPEIAKALGVEAPPLLAEDDYGDLFVVKTTRAKASIERKRFEPAP